MRKNLNLLTLAIIVAFVGLTSTMASGSGICGDSNADGAVDISDVVYLIAYIFSGGAAPDCPPLTDVDGNVYQIVTIGTQVWMAENLRVTHYRNGAAIPNVTDNAAWGGLTTGACCEYDNSLANATTYGRLYNWYAVADSRNIAPVGWHVPTDDEWKQLEMHLGMSQAEADAVSFRGTDEGGKLKGASTNYWDSPNTGATNETGFTGLPGGYRDVNMFSGAFGYMGYYGYSWSSAEYSSGYAWGRYLGCDGSQVNRTYLHPKRDGFSVRCVRD